jgi:hypothetical protein
MRRPEVESYFHQGLDFYEYETADYEAANKKILPLPLNTPVVSITAGEVVFGEKGEESVIVRTPDGKYIRYNHILSKVNAGTRIEEGELLGVIYKSPYGKVDEMHLHLEVRVGEPRLPSRSDFKDWFDYVKVFGDEFDKLETVDPVSIWSDMVKDAYVEKDDRVTSKKGDDLYIGIRVREWLHPDEEGILSDEAKILLQNVLYPLIDEVTGSFSTRLNREIRYRLSYGDKPEDTLEVEVPFNPYKPVILTVFVNFVERLGVLYSMVHKAFDAGDPVKITAITNIVKNIIRAHFRHEYGHIMGLTSLDKLAIDSDLVADMARSLNLKLTGDSVRDTAIVGNALANLWGIGPDAAREWIGIAASDL